MSVGGHADTPVDLVATGNTDAKRPCLGNGQTVLMRTMTQVEILECLSETLIRNGIPPTVVDDPDTTLSNHYTFTRKIIPVTDNRLDEENTEERHGRSGRTAS